MEAIIRIIIFLIFLITNKYLLAEPVSGHTVVLQILEKVSARISTLEIPVGAKVFYGSLEIEISITMHYQNYIKRMFVPMVSFILIHYSMKQLS